MAGTPAVRLSGVLREDERVAALLRLRQEGYRRWELAERVAMTVPTMDHLLQRVRAEVGVRTLAELDSLAAELLLVT